MTTTDQSGTHVIPPSVLTGFFGAGKTTSLNGSADQQSGGHDAFTALVGDLAAEFVNLRAEAIDEAITDAQRRIAQALDLDRSILYQLNEAGDDFVPTHLWARPDLPVEPVPPRVSASRLFPALLAKIMAGEIVRFQPPSEVASAIGRASIEDDQTSFDVTVPLAVGGMVTGALAFGTLLRERAWSDETVGRLKLIASVFAGALARKESELALRDAHAELQRMKARLERENVCLRAEVKDVLRPSSIVGQSAMRGVMGGVMDRVQQVGPTGATVLLLGETGTGKELIASQVHAASPRRSHVMVRINCAAIPAALVESELFGREKGAYTGALSRQIGRFEMADRSTIFLDEIGDLPPEVQVKLLRVIQEREFERLGGSHPIKIDVRIIAATHRNLEELVASGGFREDLYYRLNVFPITIPPLRERPDDIEPLVLQFVEEFSRTFGKRISSVSRDSLHALRQYPWPGNVRELRNVVERAMIVASDGHLVIAPPHTLSAATPRSPAWRVPKLTYLSRDHITEVLQAVGWRIRGAGGAAERLGLKPTTLEARMVRLGIQRPGSFSPQPLA